VNLDSLTELQRQVYEAIIAPGVPVPWGSRAAIASRLGITTNTLMVLTAKVRLKLGLRKSTARRPKERRVLGVCPHDIQETPEQARARVRRELESGQRCRRCHLLLPCGHAQARAA